MNRQGNVRRPADRRGRRRLDQRTARTLQENLRTWYLKKYGTKSALASDLKIPRSTVVGWFAGGPGKAKVPDAAQLAALARKGLSLDWLFTGEGPETRGSALPTSDTADALWRHVVAAVQHEVVPDQHAAAPNTVPTSTKMLDLVTRSFVRRARERRQRSLDAMNARLALENFALARQRYQGKRLPLALAAGVGGAEPLLRGIAMTEPLLRGIAMTDAEWPEFASKGVVRTPAAKSKRRRTH